MGDNGKHSAGRPTEYRPKYCKEIINFFNIEPYRSFLKKTITKKNGEVIKEYEERGATCPFIGQFARKIGVSPSSILRWEKKYPEFRSALKVAKNIQEELIAINGLNNSYNASFSIFTLKNVAGWRDVKDIKGVSVEKHTHFTNINVSDIKNMPEEDVIGILTGRIQPNRTSDTKDDQG